tara:strand:+ start:4276 stop:5295 length:1020 start_codon:yes stop_codon:yes gene_type:complete
MIFQKIESIRYHNALSTALENSKNVYVERSGYIIKIYFDNYCGCGEAAPLPLFSQENIKQVEWQIEELKTALIVGHQYSIEDLYDLFEVFSKGCPSLNFALDIALCDILSQMNKISLAKHLNKNALETVRLSAINVKSISQKSSIKIKFGTKQLNEDIRILNDISKKNPNVSLRVDFNRLCNVDDAIFICNALKKCNIEYIEEPLEKPLKQDYVKLKRAINFPIALDESIIDKNYKKLIDSNLIDYAILKPALFGGIKEINKLYKYLISKKIQLIFSSSLQTQIGNISEIQIASALELDSQHGLNNYAFFDNKFKALYDANSQHVNLEKVIGLGACWDD